MNAASTRGGGFLRALATLLVAALLAGAAWTWFSLNWSYSEGDRGGVLQKFSRKGWICKTYEGELALYIVGGVAPEIWNFSVRDRLSSNENLPLRISPRSMRPMSRWMMRSRFFVKS